MNILHLASFTGNIGDNANHLGFRLWFEKVLGRPVCWTDLEIREYYWKEKRFDESFVKLTSKFDLLVIGGGNYFELWVDHSHTGTSIDISPDIFAQIKIPVFFNALGCDASQGVTENTIKRFNAFLNILVKSPQYLVTVRNDGAKNVINKYLPRDIAEKVITIPDGGFFLEHEDVDCRYLKSKNKKIGINLACDMPAIRFRNFGGADGYSNFCDEFAKMLENIADKDKPIDFIFFPHIHSDLKIISDVIARLNDRLRRTRIKTAPYAVGQEGAKHVFGLYRCCDLVLGMRFHANVCPIGMGIPTIGLCNYPQIEFLYDELNCSDRCISVEKPGFSSKLSDFIIESLCTGELIEKRANKIIQDIAQLRKDFEPVLRAWFGKNKIS